MDIFFEIDRWLLKGGVNMGWHVFVASFRGCKHQFLKAPFPRKVSKIGLILHLPLEMTSCYSSINWHVELSNGYVLHTFKDTTWDAATPNKQSPPVVSIVGDPHVSFTSHCCWHGEHPCLSYIYKYIYTYRIKGHQKMHVHTHTYKSICIFMSSLEI